jgi:hypothetical protein
VKCFLIGYLVCDVLEFDQQAYDWKGVRLVMHEYDVLSNIVERDQLEEVGQTRHLRSLFEKGQRQGLSQVELFELGKYLDLNYTSKGLVYHCDYLRNLKS